MENKYIGLIMDITFIFLVAYRQITHIVNEEMTKKEKLKNYIYIIAEKHKYCSHRDNTI